MDIFYFNGISYVVIADYFSKFQYMFKMKTSFGHLQEHLIILFVIEGYPDEVVTDFSPSWRLHISPHHPSIHGAMAL